MQRITIHLPEAEIGLLSQVAGAYAIKRATLMRIIIEQWLDSPRPISNRLEFGETEAENAKS